MLVSLYEIGVLIGRERGILQGSRRVGGHGMNSGAGMVVYMMVCRLWSRSTLVILSLLSLALTVLSLLLLRLAILALWRSLLEWLRGLAVWVYLRLVRVGVVLSLRRLGIMVRVLRIANYTGWAGGRWHWVRVDRVALSRLCLSIRGGDGR